MLANLIFLFRAFSFSSFSFISLGHITTTYQPLFFSELYNINFRFKNSCKYKNSGPFIARTFYQPCYAIAIRVDELPYRKLHLTAPSRASVLTYSAVVANDNKISRMCRRVDFWFLSVLSSHMWPRKISIIFWLFTEHFAKRVQRSLWSMC